MKHYLLYILLFVSVGILNGMDQDQEENRFSVCNQIKQINQNASRAAYLELAKNLSKNNLSTCACMTYLMREREKKAIGLMKVSEKTKNVIKGICQQQQQNDADEKNGIPLTIHCAPSIDPAMQIHIAEKFSGKYRPSIVPTEEFCPSGMYACGSRFITLSARIKTDGSGGFFEFAVKNPEIGINALLKNFHPSARNAVLEHEKHHLEANHHILRSLWNSAASLDHIVNGGQETYTNKIDEQQKNAFAKLMRAQEAEADRIPPACNDCKLASDFVESSKGLNSSNTKMSNYFKGIDTSSHPSNEKRLLWAQRIYNLKLAEHELKQNFEKSKNLGYQE